MFIADSLNICDPVLAYEQIMEKTGIEKYLKPETSYHLRRSGYNRVNMLKTILFGFMDTGYACLRELEERYGFICTISVRICSKCGNIHS